MEKKNKPKLSDLYELSRDYDLLCELTEQGYRIPCFIDYRSQLSSKISKDIAQTNFHTYYDVGCRGISYADLNYTKEEFIKDCKRMNLEFIVPNKQP